MDVVGLETEGYGAGAVEERGGRTDGVERDGGGLLGIEPELRERDAELLEPAEIPSVKGVRELDRVGASDDARRIGPC